MLEGNTTVPLKVLKLEVGATHAFWCKWDGNVRTDQVCISSDLSLLVTVDSVACKQDCFIVWIHAGASLCKYVWILYMSF